jgi:hypothetical protein
MTDRTHDPGNAHAETQSRAQAPAQEAAKTPHPEPNRPRMCCAMGTSRPPSGRTSARTGQPSAQSSPARGRMKKARSMTASLFPARNSCASRNWRVTRMPARMSFDRNTGWSSRGTLRRAHRNGKTIPNSPMMNARTLPRSKPSGTRIRKINRETRVPVVASNRPY